MKIILIYRNNPHIVGGILLDTKSQTVYLQRCPCSGKYDFLKGKLVQGEDTYAGAMRVVEDKTGLLLSDEEDEEDEKDKTDLLQFIPR